jgi:hypothetical protein
MAPPPAMPLVVIALQQKTSSGFHGSITAFMLFLPYSKLHALVTIVTTDRDCM